MWQRRRMWKKSSQRRKQAFGRLDILVNNAGVYKFPLPLEEVTEEAFHRHFNINVLGLLLATKEAAKLFGDEGGSIINIGSVASDLNSPNTVVYTATKGAAGGSECSIGGCHCHHCDAA
jgi:3-oxoacyl-[acyl-carrier protein] reductase